MRNFLFVILNSRILFFCIRNYMIKLFYVRIAKSKLIILWNMSYHPYSHSDGLKTVAIFQYSLLEFSAIKLNNLKWCRCTKVLAVIIFIYNISTRYLNVGILIIFNAICITALLGYRSFQWVDDNSPRIMQFKARRP